MTLGEKIRDLRTKNGMTQEKLAELLNVSRSAIAKWESDGGIPEIGNLKTISECFSVSIDSLINDTNPVEGNGIRRTVQEISSQYTGKTCDIDLIGWNDGVYNVLILGEDEFFYHYQYYAKGRQIRGVIGKKYIKTITVSKKTSVQKVDIKSLDKEYFCDKSVMLEIAHKEGLIKGFFDFRNDDYQNVIIKSFSDTTIELEFGREIELLDVCKIETIERQIPVRVRV